MKLKLVQCIVAMSLVFLCGCTEKNPLKRELVTRDGSLLHARHEGYTATALPSGNILIVGGYNLFRHFLPENGVAEVEVYDTNKHRSYEGGKLNIPRGDHAATLLPSGKVLITGGNTYHRISRSGLKTTTAIELYDPLTKQFKVVGKTIVPRYRHNAVVVGNKLYLLQGYVQAQGNRRPHHRPIYKASQIEEVDLSTFKTKIVGTLNDSPEISSYTYGPPPQLPRIGTRIFIVSSGYHGYVESFDTKTREVKIIGQLKPIRQSSTSFLVDNNSKLLIFGGHHFNSEGSVRLFDLNNHTTTLLPSLFCQRGGSTKVIAEGHLFYVFGVGMCMGDSNRHINNFIEWYPYYGTGHSVNPAIQGHSNLWISSSSQYVEILSNGKKRVFIINADREQQLFFNPLYVGELTIKNFHDNGF